MSRSFYRLDGRDDEALRRYRLAERDCPHDFIEYVAAGNALRALGVSP
ncbi:hypothetical protein NKH33_15090 [Mesorhizobium sp. M1182]